jgi:hypothetical protein
MGSSLLEKLGLPSPGDANQPGPASPPLTSQANWKSTCAGDDTPRTCSNEGEPG